MNLILVVGFVLGLWGGLVEGLLTLEGMREITNVTRVAWGHVVNVQSNFERGLETGQVSFKNEDDREEVEDTVTAALRILDTTILEMLNIPLSTPSSPSYSDQCPQIITEYHAFLSITTHFLRAVEDKQFNYRWSASSSVFAGLGWLQGIWASRQTNIQHKSFIEQQMALYEWTDCFGGDGGRGEKNEVLRRGVEVVEYVNDLLDTF